MEDYYKILGVKKNATEETIRARWIKLTKRYHPDRGNPIASDEKIKKINEAYQALKDESTRFDYDFKRRLEKDITKKRGEGGVRFPAKKIFVPTGVLVLIIIVGFVVLRWGQNNLKPEPEKLYKTKPTIEIKIPSSDPSLPLPLTLAKGELDSKKESSRKEGSKVERPSQVEKEAFRESKEGVPQERSQFVTVARKDPQSSEEPSDQPVPKPEQGDLKGMSKETSQQSAKVVPVLPPPLAKEEEIRRFFAEYIDRYTKKDIHGFLSVFSPEAIQNQKDGLEAIKNIYSRFLNQSDELQYYLDDMKIEIYQNVVEVRARYKLDQVLAKQGSEKTWRGDIRWVLIREGGALKIISLDYRNEKTP